MTDTASPRPWRVETNRFGQHYVVCESGSGDPVRDYIAGPIQNESDAALIVEAVNERDRLRDIVRRLTNMAETTIPDAMENWNGFTAGRVEFEREAYALIREARAAIGEGSANG